MLYSSKLALDRTLDATLVVLTERFGFTRSSRIGFFRYNWDNHLAPMPKNRLGDKVGLLHFAVHEIAHFIVLRQRTDPAPKGWMDRCLNRSARESGNRFSDGILGDPILELKARALQVEIIKQLQLWGVPARIKELDIPTRTRSQFTSSGRLVIKDAEYGYGATKQIMNLILKHDKSIHEWALEIAHVIQNVAVGCSGSAHEYWLERITAPGTKGKSSRRT